MDVMSKPGQKFQMCLDGMTHESQIDMQVRCTGIRRVRQRSQLSVRPRAIYQNLDSAFAPRVQVCQITRIIVKMSRDIAPHWT